MSSAQPNPSDRAQVAKQKARRFVNRAANKLARMTAEPKKPAAAPKVAAAKAKAAAPVHKLSHSEALRENGFTIFRGLFSVDECAELAAKMKAEAGITEGEHYTRVDSTNKFVSTRDVLFDPRVIDAVRQSIGEDGVFLQVSDLHYLHDTAGWHRDSVHRAPDASDAPDWKDLDGDFGVVKAILYMESDNAAMGIMAGSHLSPIEMDTEFVKSVEGKGGQIVIDATDEPNRRLTDAQKKIPLAWRALAGDLLVFDERMYHAGRRVDNGKVTKQREAAKFTLSLVFGADNPHSDRMYSYFRYARRELGYKDMPQDFLDKLAEHNLVPSKGWGNYYLEHPQDLRHAHLRNPETLEPLIEEFSQAGAAK